MDSEIFKWEGQSVHEVVGKIYLIPVGNINPDPKNLRETFEEIDIIALGHNIKEIGQMDSIKVFPKLSEDGSWHGEFDLHDGERRWRAANSVDLPYLLALIEERPSEEEIVFKRISRVLQTESLKPEEKVRAIEKTFKELNILHKPEEWEKYRDKFGASKERFAEIIRVMKLPGKLRELMFTGTMSYTIAQAIGRLPRSRQEDAAKFILSNKLYGRYVVTEFIPYLLDHPEASYAQAFDHTKVGGWRQYTKRPSKTELKPNYENIIDEFLKTCVQWERAWDKLVATEVVKEIKGKKLSPYRLKDGVNRVRELAEGLLLELFDAGGGITSLSLSAKTKLLENNPSPKKKKSKP